MPYPTPHPAVSPRFADLSEFIKQQRPDSTSDGPATLSSGQLHGDSIQHVNRASNFGDNFSFPVARGLFSSPTNFGHIQRTLSSVFNAKSHVYGSTFFGKKAFYTHEFDFKKEPLHPSDRRKIRFGLKGLVDFIIQLDVDNLKTCLLDKDTAVSKFTVHRSPQQNFQVPPDSCLGLIKRSNPSKCQIIFEILERITSNLNFSQSMGEFLASDGQIETTKLVVSEALKRGPDLGQFLRGGPFASCAQVYRNLSSKFDFDAAFFMSLKQTTLKDTVHEKQNQKKYSRPREFAQPRFAVGYCFKFQKSGECNIRNCFFKHQCADCHEKDHGAHECRKNKTRDVDKKPRARLPFNPTDRS